MTFNLVPFVEKDHLTSAALALLSVREATQVYPPTQDANADVESFKAWLTPESEVHARWAALVDGEVAGHVMLSPALPYMVDHLESHGYDATNCAEVNKLFVDPSQSKHGIGGALLESAIEVARSQGRRAVLAVVSTSTQALRLYRHSSLVEVEPFHGRHGENRVFMAAD